MEYFGLKLQTLRKKASMSQLDLAELVGVSRQAISKWERGEALPDLYNAKKIAEVFNITLDELMDIEIKSIDKEKTKTNKLALSFLLVPGFYGAISIIFGILSLFGSLFVSMLAYGAILIIYGILYVICFYNLYIGKNTSKYKIGALILNFLLLAGYLIFLIVTIGESSAGYILFMVILLAIIVLGIVGGFLYNPELQPDKSNDLLKKHKGYIMAFKIIVILVIVRYLFTFGYFILSK